MYEFDICVIKNSIVFSPCTLGALVIYYTCYALFLSCLICVAWPIHNCHSCRNFSLNIKICVLPSIKRTTTVTYHTT